MYAELHDTPTHAKPRVSTRARAHAYLRERALPRALGLVWPSAGGCKTASRKKFLSKRRVSRVRCARASTEPRFVALIVIVIVSGQTVNRFAYVMNNPLAYTDPSGYFSLKKLFRAVLAIAVGYFTGQWIGWHAMAVPGITSMQVGIISGMAGGFAGGLVASGGNIKGALQGALTGGLFGWAGEIGGVTSPSRYLAHATAGCISAVAGGGKCGQGAVSAMFGKYTTNWIGQNTSIQSDIAKGIATTVAGGVGSVIAGGKFENGATTAAYGYVFNWMMHVHASITADALKTQLPAGSASELAKAVALTDMNPSWSVSQDPANAVWHGMCTGGDSTSACDLKKTDYMDKQWQAKSPAGFARLAHAIQDYEAPMHAGKPYSGFATRTEAIAHGLSDLRPPPQEYDRLVNRTRQLFIDYNKHCNGCLR